jgi:protoporphyrinogen oxidase
MSEGTARVAVIGAGPAGATAAYCLAKAGAEVDVYEASGGVGGTARSIELWGQTVDIGPHRFHSTDPQVNELWLEVIGGDYEMVQRLSRVLFRGRFSGRLYHYPPRAREALSALGALEALRCLASYAGRRLRDPGDTFASRAAARFGERLYGHGLAAYAEKVWGVPAAELDAELARRCLADLPDTGWFPHPRQGTGEVYARMCDHVEKQGGRVHLDTPVARLVLDGDRVAGVQLNSAEIVEHDHVVSSMPLTALAGRLPGVPAEVAAAAAELRFRNTVVVYLRTTAESVFPDNWVYVPSPDLRTGRITNFDNWVPSTKHGERETVLALEYWCDPGDDFWRWDDERYVALARTELAETGLVGAGEIIDGEVLRVPKSCPVYRRGFREHLRVVEDHLRRLEGLQVIGRYGAFRYNSQADSILMGMSAAGNIVAGPGRDHPRPQRTHITATGLSPTPPSRRRR